MRCVRPTRLALMMLLTWSGAAMARADLFGFHGITNNNASSTAAGEAQLFMDVTQVGSQVLFTFLNIGPADSSITDVYYHDMLGMLSFASLDDSDPGVDFGVGASPPDLPGGNNVIPAFSATDGFDSEPPAQPNGVNPGEYLGIYFTLNGGNTFASVLAALFSGDLRVGLHVQGFAGGYSEGFINNTNPVPAPGALALAALGLGGVSRFRRRAG